MQLREAIASPKTLLILFKFSIARVVKYTLDDFSNIFLIQQQKAILSVEALAQTAAGIAQIIDTDEYEVEEVLENWLEFLQKQQISRSKNTLQSLSFQLSRLVK
ncbi:hypothetical protein [Nostoc sp. NMS8]|uniref:hypothetical protein n=1 Tax=Nostoc sp. NMS8 TaxID=2815392 RepID=UPI0025ED03B4|nr:hypothetical protein [Nostoc sp. NMS8]MBN3962253.1 hypothetical protein [Nostoc sp. NMS8]